MKFALLALAATVQSAKLNTKRATALAQLKTALDVGREACDEGQTWGEVNYNSETDGFIWQKRQTCLYNDECERG